MRSLAFLGCLSLLSVSILATEPASVADLAKKARPSLVLITAAGRGDTNESRLGTGFIISADGLIATNLHVIGEARPFARRGAAEGRGPGT